MRSKYKRTGLWKGLYFFPQEEKKSFNLPFFESSLSFLLEVKEGHLLFVRQVLQYAHVIHSINNGLAHLSPLPEVFLGGEGMVIPGSYDFLGYGITEGRNTVERRQEFPVHHFEFGGCRLVQADRQEFQTPEIHFRRHFDDCGIAFLHSRGRFQASNAGQFLFLGFKSLLNDRRFERSIGADG